MKKKIAVLVTMLLIVSAFAACMPGGGSLVTFGNVFRESVVTSGNANGVATSGNVPYVPTSGNARVVTSGNAAVADAIGQTIDTLGSALKTFGATDVNVVEHPDGGKEITFAYGDAKYSLSACAATRTEGTVPSGTWDVTKEEDADGAAYGIGYMNDGTCGQAVWTNTSMGLFCTLTQSGNVSEETLTQMAEQLLGAK